MWSGHFFWMNFSTWRDAFRSDQFLLPGSAARRPRWRSQVKANADGAVVTHLVDRRDTEGLVECEGAADAHRIDVAVCLDRRAYRRRLRGVAPGSLRDGG